MGNLITTVLLEIMEKVLQMTTSTFRDFREFFRLPIPLITNKETIIRE